MEARVPNPIDEDGKGGETLQFLMGLMEEALEATQLEIGIITPCLRRVARIQNGNCMFISVRCGQVSKLRCPSANCDGAQMER